MCIVICLLLLHTNADLPVVAVLRVTLYTGSTRHAVLQNNDTWDAMAQSLWLLCVPAIVLLLFVFQLNDALAIYPARRRRTEIWTDKGISQSIV